MLTWTQSQHCRSKCWGLWSRLHVIGLHSSAAEPQLLGMGGCEGAEKQEVYSAVGEGLPLHLTAMSYESCGSLWYLRQEDGSF